MKKYEKLNIVGVAFVKETHREMKQKNPWMQDCLWKLKCDANFLCLSNFRKTMKIKLKSRKYYAIYKLSI